MFYCVLPQHFYHLTFSVYAYRECARIACVFGEICRSRYCSQYTFFRTAMRNYSTSYQCELPVHASYRTKSIIELSSIAYRPLQTNLNSTQQISNCYNEENRCYYTLSWQMSLPYNVTSASQTHNVFWSFKSDHRQGKLLFAWLLNIPNRTFPLEIMSLDELMNMQNQQIGAHISHTNFKKLG